MAKIVITITRRGPLDGKPHRKAKQCKLQYTVDGHPPSPDTHVHPGDSVIWNFQDSAWAVAFSGQSPFSKCAFGGVGGQAYGGKIIKGNHGDQFPYSVVLFDVGSAPTVDDPRIIID